MRVCLAKSRWCSKLGLAHRRDSHDEPVCCRKETELSGEIMGLQDVLLEAGAEAAAKALRLRELDAQIAQQRQQLDMVCPGAPEVRPSVMRLMLNENSQRIHTLFALHL